MPFLDRAGLGVGVEKFDFSVEGVTAISCDIVGSFFRKCTSPDTVPA